MLVHNYSPAMLERWDCTWEQLRMLNPNLVMVSVSPYGHTGPLADRPGAGTMAEAFAGLTHMTGEADGPPMLTSIPLGDTLTGIFGLIGTLVACYGRDVNSLGGQHVDVSMYEPILTLMGSTLAAWDPDGDDPPPMRFGSRLETGVPRNIYRTADNRYLCLSGTTDRQVERILALTGRDGPEDQAKFARMADRLAHNDELDALVVADWIAQRPLEEAIAVFVEARIPGRPGPRPARPAGRRPGARPKQRHPGGPRRAGIGAHGHPRPLPERDPRHHQPPRSPHRRPQRRGLRRAARTGTPPASSKPKPTGWSDYSSPDAERCNR